MIDVNSNRAAPKWTRREKFGRLLWSMAKPLFRLSPRPMWGWRRVLLRTFGASVGEQVQVYPSTHITIPWNLTLENYSAVGDHAILYALGPIRIGARSTVSQGAHLCAGTHDISDSARPLLKLPISIGNDAWVCADAFIGPGVVVGDGAIVGARAVAMKDIPPNTIVAGNPARYLRSTA